MTLARELETKTEAEDFLGVGNLMLDVLMRPSQEDRPDADALLLEQSAPKVVRRKFKVPETVTIPSVFRDQHIAAADRGNWAKDRFIDLVITAYMLGASRSNLPPPHDKLVAYYRDTALKQEAVLSSIASANACRKPKYSAFAERITAIQAEHEHRTERLRGLDLDGKTLERLTETLDNLYRNAVLALANDPEFRYE
jgi:hypothetical protein